VLVCCGYCMDGSIDWRVDPRVISTLLEGEEISLGARDVKPLHPEVKGGPLDSQTCGCPVGTCDNPPGLLESLANVVSLRVLKGNRSRDSASAPLFKLARGGCRTLPEVRITLRFDEILELANVPRPLIRDEGKHRFRRNVSICLPIRRA